MNSIVMTPVLAQYLTAGALSLLVSLFVSILLVRTRRWHMRWTSDSAWHLPQKIHQDAVPRIGGVAIVAGFLAGLFYCFGVNEAGSNVLPSMTNTGHVLWGLAPVVAVGFAEDLTKRVSPRVRLVGMVVGSFVLLYGLQVSLPRLDIALIDPLMQYWGVALVFSIFACVGATNAYNIVDGLNGLLGGVALITLWVVAWVAYDVGDLVLCGISGLLAFAVVGWLPSNWPRGRLFAGDGGAYALGFLSAALIIMLLHRHPEVSPWFGLTAAALPIWETLYSIWRRQRTGVSALEPDHSHLHQLLRTRMHWMRTRRALRSTVANSTLPADDARVTVSAPNGSCSPLLWGLHAVAAAGGAFFYRQPAVVAAIFGAFVLVYIGLHARLVRSRTKYRLVLG